MNLSNCKKEKSLVNAWFTTVENSEGNVVGYNLTVAFGLKDPAPYEYAALLVVPEMDDGKIDVYFVDKTDVEKSNFD